MSQEADGSMRRARMRVLASVALGFLLFAATLGIGYLAWNVATWNRGQTPAQRLLGLRCWDPEAGRVPGRRQMVERQFFNLVLSSVSLVVLVFFMFSDRNQTSAGDVVLGTIVLPDPHGELPS